MNLPPYVADILSQPEGLRRVLANYQPEKLVPIAARIAAGGYQRMVMTGMGASYTSCYPAYLMLTRLNLPVAMIETSELLHAAPGAVNSQTLLWVQSQSGQSAEVSHLVANLQEAPAATTVGVTDNLGSPLGRYASPTIALYSGVEATVSTRSYLNTLAVSLLGAVQLTGGDLNQACGQLLQAVDAVEAYLANWQARVVEIKEQVGIPKKLMVIGRGPSLAAVRTSSFTMKESTKEACEGMEAAQFRHGPLEMADGTLSLLVFEGLSRYSAMNRQIALEVADHGGHAFWISPRADTLLPTLPLPAVPELAQPLVEILPLQMLTIALAELLGREPGKFRYMGKVTLVE